MTSSLHIKDVKIDNLVIFRAISINIVGQAYLEVLSHLQLINVIPGKRSALVIIIIYDFIKQLIITLIDKKVVKWELFDI